MKVEAKTYWLPKKGNQISEYEDAFYPKGVPRSRKGAWRFAVSDGASESMLSGPWAEILVKTFCRSSAPVTAVSVRGIVARAAKAYESWLEEYLRRREREGRPVQWYEEPGLQVGAYATLLGLSLASDPTGESLRWEAVSLGDSCLFQVRDGALIANFAIGNSREFGSRPVLISSRPDKNGTALSRLELGAGECLSGDRLYLMTDAMAAWFLREHESGNTPWAALEGSDFQDLVDRLRDEGLVRNDDVTVTCIRVV